MELPATEHYLNEVSAAQAAVHAAEQAFVDAVRRAEAAGIAGSLIAERLDVHVASLPLVQRDPWPPAWPDDWEDGSGPWMTNP